MRRWLVLVLLGLAATVSARELLVCPERGVQPFLGLDDTSVGAQARAGRAEDLQNIQLDVSESARKRFGTTLVGDTCDDLDDTFDQSAITGLYFTRFSSGTERIIQTCSDRFQYLDGVTWRPVYGIGTVSGVVVITGGSTNQFVWATALDNMVGANGVDRPLRYDGSTLTLVDFTDLANTDEPDVAEAVAWFKNYLIFGNTQEGGVSYPTRFRWSNVGMINRWTSVNFIDIDALGGQEITAMAELYDNLYVFLTHSIYKISLVGGVNTFNVSKVSDTIGTISKNSVRAITLTNSQQGLVFLDRAKRIYFFNGIYPQDISILIQTTLGGLQESRLAYAVSADTKTDYYLCASRNSATINDTCLDLQYQIGEWTKHTNLHANAMTSIQDTAGLRQTLYGDYGGLTYQLGTSVTQRNDINTLSGTVDAVDRYTTSTATGLQVLYITDLVTGPMIGAPVEMTSGEAINATGIVVAFTTSGIVVRSDISPAPIAGNTLEVGAIDAFYTTQWEDMGFPARIKQFGEVYFWADADVTSTISVAYATDYNTTISTQTFPLSPSSTDATWGNLTYGNVDTVFRQVKLEAEGRSISVTFSDDDPNEVFTLQGWNTVYWLGEVN